MYELIIKVNISARISLKINTTETFFFILHNIYKFLFQMTERKETKFWNKKQCFNFKHILQHAQVSITLYALCSAAIYLLFYEIKLRRGT